MSAITEKSSNIVVRKRNNEEEYFSFDKLSKVIGFACSDFQHSLDTPYQPSKIMQSLIPNLRNYMSTKDIHQEAIKIAVEKTSIQEPEWQFTAAKLLLYKIKKEASINRGYPNEGYDSFYELITRLTDDGLYGTYILENYSRDDIDELQLYIKPERDYLFNYVGLKTLVDRYLIKGYNNEILELPQELFMGVAMHLAIPEGRNKVTYAKQFYDCLSKLEMTVATPTLSNARRVHHQLSSCFIDTVDDNLWSIYDVNQSFAQVSKHGGGQGIYIGKIRGRSSNIRGVKNAAGGVIPWVKGYNNTAIAVDQLGVRRGAVAIYLDIWHKDVMDFLNVKTNNGDDRLKAHDIFPGVCIPDLFMKTLQERGVWHLFDPHEVKQLMGWSLEDCYDESLDGGTFSNRYNECVSHPLLSRVDIPAIDIAKVMLRSQAETGTPFVFFRDETNRKNPNKHKGMIYCSNLCTEICQNMSPTTREEVSTDEQGYTTTRVKNGDFVVCNLSSINLGNVHTEEDIKRVVTSAVRMMDNVITLNYYPVEQAKVTNQRYRAVGLGTSGYHQMLAKNQIAWESDAHYEFADRIYEWLNYYAIKASVEIAKEKAPYPYFKGSEWDTGVYFSDRNYTSEKWTELKNEVHQNGIRNGYLFAVAPTASTSLISNSTAGIDPVYQRFFIEEKKNALIPQTAPELSPKTYWFYKEAHQIDQLASIKACGVRQRHIDQGQSFNLYITPDTTLSQLLNMYMEAWKNGLKTVYYVRSKTSDIEECVSCSS